MYVSKILTGRREKRKKCEIKRKKYKRNLEN
jgi:hypothetical protein